MRNVKNFSPRIGATSYIVEAGLLENLLWLPEGIGEMQLVLFDADGYSNIPTEGEVGELARASLERDIAFTVHLPGVIDFGSDDSFVRDRSLELFRKTVERTKRLEPICWVFHAVNPESPPADKGIDDVDVKRYIDRIADGLSEMMPLFDTPRELAIENVRRDFRVESEIVRMFDTSVCVDVGHLLLYGQDVYAFLDEWLPRCRNIHLHGINENGDDHSSVALIPEEELSRFVRRVSMEAALKTVTMEVFGERDFESSFDAITRSIARFAL